MRRRVLIRNSLRDRSRIEGYCSEDLARNARSNMYDSTIRIELLNESLLSFLQGNNLYESTSNVIYRDTSLSCSMKKDF